MRATTPRWMAIAAATVFGAAVVLAREPATVKTGEIVVQAGREGCPVELDSALAGKTDAKGSLTLHEVEPGEHYVHVHCSGEDESVYLVSVDAGKSASVHGITTAATPAPPNETSPESAPETKVHLRQIVQHAVQLRARGRLDEAIPLLREAILLDPANSDLHCELGITFLLGRDWKNARVEMLEALHQDSTNAEAQNGLGYALEKLGNLDGALNAYHAASKLDPDDPTYRTHYFDLLSKLAQQKATKK